MIKIIPGVLFMLLEVQSILGQCMPPQRQIIVQPIMEQNQPQQCAPPPQLVIPAIIKPLDQQRQPNCGVYQPTSTSTNPSSTTIILQEDDNNNSMHPLLLFSLMSMMNNNNNNNNNGYPRYESDCYRRPYYDSYSCNDRYSSYSRGSSDRCCSYNIDKDYDGNEINLIIRPNDEN